MRLQGPPFPHLGTVSRGHTVLLRYANQSSGAPQTTPLPPGEHTGNTQSLQAGNLRPPRSCLQLRTGLWVSSSFQIKANSSLQICPRLVAFFPQSSPHPGEGGGTSELMVTPGKVTMLTRGPSAAFYPERGGNSDVESKVWTPEGTVCG